ncbi:hypothetical protein T440DRAFT_71640 [Plenodomus tracheiphilus IPT5]|uniref:Uncharacterized protein n=1 Tax=Plenodomus tracheiphilus IPT5 TaxID=1408161 RepID=A0A6A7BA07_9PLEO|nr:hypothetical protein T440DRAFT_71640 [Plenodomus tracheiphilus IPT5]
MKPQCALSTEARILPPSLSHSTNPRDKKQLPRTAPISNISTTSIAQTPWRRQYIVPPHKSKSTTPPSIPTYHRMPLLPLPLPTSNAISTTQRTGMSAITARRTRLCVIASHPPQPPTFPAFRIAPLAMQLCDFKTPLMLIASKAGETAPPPRLTNQTNQSTQRIN